MVAAVDVVRLESSSFAPAELEDVLSDPGISDQLDLCSVDASLQRAALQGNLPLVKQLIASGGSVNAPLQCDSSDGDTFATLMHGLCSQPELPNGMAVLEEVVKARANVNARSSIGLTPLERACIHKHEGAVLLLLSSGARCDPCDDRGRAALDCAVSLTPKRVPGGDGHDGHDGTTLAGGPAMAEEETSARLVALLAAQRADLDGSSNHGTAPLLHAIQHNNLKGVQALVSHGAQPRFLHEAVESSSAPIITLLLEGHANPFEEDRRGRSVMDVAFGRGDETITARLRESIGDLERSRGWSDDKMASSRRGSNTLRMPNRDSSRQISDEDEHGLGLSRERRKTKPHAEEGGTASPERRHSPRATHLTASVAEIQPTHPTTLAGRLLQQIPDTDATRAIGAELLRMRRRCEQLVQLRWFQGITLAALLVALFFPDFWVIADFPSSGLDVILIFVLLVFLVELFATCFAMPGTYIGSLLFWMDVIGMVPVLLDFSFVSEKHMRTFDNWLVMRAANPARLSLVIRPQAMSSTGAGTAKSMSDALVRWISIYAAILVVVMAMVVPLVDLPTYPQDDYSMRMWVNTLEYSLHNHPEDVAERFIELEDFYADKDYMPVKVKLRYANGTEILHRLRSSIPELSKNRFEVTSDSGAVWALFDLGGTNRTDAWCHIVLLVIILVLLAGFPQLLCMCVSRSVVDPLENMFRGEKQLASKIFKSVYTMTTRFRPETGDAKAGKDETFGNEAELFQKVIDRLSTLRAMTMKRAPVDKAALEQLGEAGSHAVGSFRTKHMPTISVRKRSSLRSVSSGDADQRIMTDLFHTLEKHLASAGLAWDVVDSWDFNALDVEAQQRHLVCICFVIFTLGLEYHTNQQQVLESFVKTVSGGYTNQKKAPYHNWCHAVDVTHCLFRMLNLCSAERYLSVHERYALLISAICHDIGHPGLNNPFLVETAHELAIRYNDSSPLENMHCAKLFEIATHGGNNVFENLDKAEFREVRLVCIEAILHTDNAQHFSMVKDIQMLYEMNSGIFDVALQMCSASQIDFPPLEIVELFGDREHKKLLRNLLLHFSDTSNPWKPFDICKKWAWFILDEFFLQGDREKELGITVQPLNDRDKVNRPYSQVGFIEFFVAPFVFSTVRLMPPLMPCTDQLMDNLTTWCEEWVSTTVPTPEMEEQLKLQDRIAKLQAKYVFREGF